jgi:AraC-like DNA-binding protein
VSCAHSTFVRVAEIGGHHQARAAEPAALLSVHGVGIDAVANGGEARGGEAGDPLADFLSRLHFPGWRVGVIEVDGQTPHATEPSVIYFYLAIAGEVEVHVDGENSPVRLRHGDAAIIASRSRHELVRASRSDGGAFERVRVLFGSSSHGIAGSQQMESLLPSVAFFAANEATGPQCCEGFVDWLAAETESTRPGAAAVASRFLLSMFVEKLRSHLVAAMAETSSHSENQIGPLQAALDPCLGVVLRLVHARPERDWTVHSMARESGLSRSAFADRFRTLVGQPPLQYVTELRLQKATELLETTDVPVKRIAALVGYESVSAFSSAFKRRFGGPPVSVRPKTTGRAPLGRR